MSQGGSGTAALAARQARQIDRYLAACQLGITLSSLGLGWLGEPAFARLHWSKQSIVAARTSRNELHRSVCDPGGLCFTDGRIGTTEIPWLLAGLDLPWAESEMMVPPTGFEPVLPP